MEGLGFVSRWSAKLRNTPINNAEELTLGDKAIKALVVFMYHVLYSQDIVDGTEARLADGNNTELISLDNPDDRATATVLGLLMFKIIPRLFSDEDERLQVTLEFIKYLSLGKPVFLDASIIPQFREHIKSYTDSAKISNDLDKLISYVDSQTWPFNN